MFMIQLWYIYEYINELIKHLYGYDIMNNQNFNRNKWTSKRVYSNWLDISNYLINRRVNTLDQSPFYLIHQICIYQDLLVRQNM